MSTENDGEKTAKPNTSRLRLNARLRTTWREATRQFVSYALIGTLTNLLGYGSYLVLTEVGLSPKIVVTILYFSATSIGFVANKRLTFRYEGGSFGAGFRYLLAQLLGYSMNLLILASFVDCLGFKHQVAQAGAIVIVAIFLFFASRFYVFPRTDEKIGEEQA